MTEDYGVYYRQCFRAVTPLMYSNVAGPFHMYSSQRMLNIYMGCILLKPGRSFMSLRYMCKFTHELE